MVVVCSDSNPFDSESPVMLTIGESTLWLGGSLVSALQPFEGRHTAEGTARQGT